MAVQRVRVKYGRSDALQFVSHLDMMRLCERAFRRAGLPLAYSEGHMPRPRLSIAAALPVGVTSEAELLDVYLNRRVSPFYFLKQLEPQLPEGVRAYEAVDVPMDWPSLQSQVREAEYHVTVAMDASSHAIQAALDGFLDRQSVPWEHRRDKEVRRYDLRELVHDLWVAEGTSPSYPAPMRRGTIREGAANAQVAEPALPDEVIGKGRAHPGPRNDDKGTATIEIGRAHV